MSPCEEACRWSIAEAYVAWAVARQYDFDWLGMCRALGLQHSWL
jgi:hypothetical protein